MSEIMRGDVSKAYVEIDPSTKNCTRICLFLGGSTWIEFTGITLKDGFVLPSPLGCECVAIDISDRTWEHANYEITFASSYSDEGTFYAKHASEVSSITWT
jgi:hypothetical protein